MNVIRWFFGFQVVCWMVDELWKAVFERMIFGDSGSVYVLICLVGVRLI